MSDLLIEGLHLDLQPKAREHRERCHRLGIEIVFRAGFRTWAEQMTEYEKGRARTPGGWVVVDDDLVVTRALPDRAPHCRGAAYDCYPLYKERAATMDPRHGWSHGEIEAQMRLWLEVVRIGADELGLGAGARWPKLKDFPHFEMPGWRSLPLETLGVA